MATMHLYHSTDVSSKKTRIKKTRIKKDESILSTEAQLVHTFTVWGYTLADGGANTACFPVVFLGSRISSLASIDFRDETVNYNIESFIHRDDETGPFTGL